MSESAQLTALLAAAQSIVFLGGAGVSTASGIPDFRSAESRCQTMQRYGHTPEEILSQSFFQQQPELFFRYYRQQLLHLEAQPNPAHRALARLQQGKLRALITQNIDGLHQKAGSRNVLELHGSVWDNYCLNCGLRYEPAFLRDAEAVPHCLDCGSIVRPGVVLYEEMLPAATLRQAERAVKQADLLLVGGTSLAVYPAAGLLHHAGRAKLVLINKTPTPFDQRASLVLRTPIDQLLDQAVPEAALG